MLEARAGARMATESEWMVYKWVVVKTFLVRNCPAQRIHNISLTDKWIMPEDVV